MRCTDGTAEKTDHQYKDGPELKNCEPRNVLTCLPLEYIREAAAIAGDNGVVMSVMCLIGHIATTTKQRCVRIHQKLIEKSLSSEWRRKIIKLWRDSDTTECIDRKDYVIGSRSLPYQFKTEIQNPNKCLAVKLRQLRSSKQQNSLSVAAPTLLPSVGEGLGSLAGVRVIGVELGDSVEFVWLEFDGALADGAGVLGWDEVKAVAAFGCSELVDDCELDEADLATEARAAVIEAGVAEEKVDRTVMAQLEAIKRFRGGKNSVRYSGGRVHNRLTALPGWYRDRYIGFGGGTDKLDGLTS